MKDVELGKPTSFLDHAIRVAFKENVRLARILWTITEVCSNRGFPISSWSFDMEGHAKKCVERYCELANKTTQQLYKVAPCMDDHQLRDEETGSEKKWYGTHTDKPDGSWDQIAENMKSNFSGSGHPIFRAFERGELRSKEHGKKSIQFNGSDENIELLLRAVISANQLSVNGAIADLCKELSEDFRASGKPEAPDHLETMEIACRKRTILLHS